MWLCVSMTSSCSVVLIMQEGLYSHLGQLAAMALVHGGGAMNILCPSVFNFLTGMLPSDLIVSVNEIPDTNTKEVLRKVSITCHVPK